jgi:DNA (cytosine-5)-methyltransferase 1
LSERRFKALDLCCKAGGMTKGLQRAGFYVVGVDIEEQPNYCGDEFFQADALTFDLSGFDLVCVSPPCQKNLHGLNAVNVARGRTLRHVDLIAPFRARLAASGLPYIIENVVGASLHNPVRLCGTSFGLPIRRHRLFESNLLLLTPPCDHARFAEPKYPTNFRPGGRKVLSTVVQVYGNTAGSHLWPEALGIDWMNRAELMQAIPPVYGEHFGRQVMGYLIQNAERAA